MGLDASFYTDAPPADSDNICDVSRYHDLHEMICAQAGELVYPGYDDFYIDADALAAIADHIQADMDCLGIKAHAGLVWDLDDSIPVKPEDYENCLPYYLRVVRALFQRLKRGGRYIYAFSC